MTGTSARARSTVVVDAPPGYRTFTARLVRSQALGASFVRLTLAGEELRDFGPSGDDQRIKLLIPRGGQRGDVTAALAGPDWYAAWLAQPDDQRPHMRTYTVRAARPEQGEIDVDVVLHGVDDGHAGPAAAWAAAALPGAGIAIVGPDRPGRGRPWGSEWSPPADARWLLLAGDETAVPAVGVIVESLPPGVRATACLEVPEAGDRLAWDVSPDVDIRWSVRADDPAAAHGELLTRCVHDAIAENAEINARGGVGAPAAAPDEVPLEDVDVDTDILWEVPEEDAGAGSLGGTYAWLAGEAGVIKSLRRHLVSELGVPRTSVAFMGYWRLGRAESD